LSENYSVRTSRKEDETEIMKLITNTFDTISSEVWAWKYRLNPVFDSSLVFVAEKDGKVVGCSNYLPRNLKISNPLEVEAVLGADFAVHPQFRGQGIGTSLIRFSRSSGALKKRGATVSYGFIDPKMLKFHESTTGSIALPLSTVMYKRFLSCRPLREKMMSINSLIQANEDLRGRLAELDLRVLFRLRGFPPFVVEIKDGEVNVEEEVSSECDVLLGGDYSPVRSLLEGEKGMFSLLKMLFTGKVKIRGSLGKIHGFYRFYKILKAGYKADCRVR